MCVSLEIYTLCFSFHLFPSTVESIDSHLIAFRIVLHWSANLINTKERKLQTLQWVICVVTQKHVLWFAYAIQKHVEMLQLARIRRCLCQRQLMNESIKSKWIDFYYQRRPFRAFCLCGQYCYYIRYIYFIVFWSTKHDRPNRMRTMNAHTVWLAHRFWLTLHCALEH